MDEKCFNLIKECVHRGLAELSVYYDSCNIPALTTSNLTTESLYLRILYKLFPDFNKDICIANFQNTTICGEINYEAFKQIEATTNWNFEVIEREVLVYLAFYLWLKQDEPDVKDNIAFHIRGLFDCEDKDIENALNLAVVTDVLDIHVPYKSFQDMDYTLHWLLKNKKTFVSAVEKYFTKTYGEIGNVMVGRICDIIADDLDFYLCINERCYFISHPSLNCYITEHNNEDTSLLLSLACSLSGCFCSACCYEPSPHCQNSNLFTCVTFFAPAVVDYSEWREYDFGYENTSILALLLLDELAKRGDCYASN